MVCGRENIMRFLKREKLGYQPFTGNPNEQLQIKVKNGVVYSKFLKYKFKLPEGAQLERFNYNSVWLDNDYYDFGKHCLISGGYCNYHSGEIKEGEWKLDLKLVPEDFPSEYVDKLIQEINVNIPWGCCGGCI